MSAYLSLLYNEVSMKAAHNAYQRDEPLLEQLLFNPRDPANAGCRAVELDISGSPHQQWSVGHKSSYDARYRQLSLFLQQLQSWSSAHSKHDPITVHLDLKHTEQDYIDGLDSYIRTHLNVKGGTKILSPGHFIQGSENLGEAVKRQGWPSLADLRGHFIICLTGDKNAKATYAKTAPATRLCFADLDLAADEIPVAKDRVFFNYHLWSNMEAQWAAVFRHSAKINNTVVRGYELNGESLWNSALRNGCNILATNKIRNHAWAKVGDTPFVRLHPLNS